MPIRTLQPSESYHLEQLKKSLQARLQGLGMTLALLAIPAAFVLFAIAAGRHASFGDRVALGLSALILTGLLGGIALNLSRNRSNRRWTRQDARTLSALNDDLLTMEVQVGSFEISAKEGTATEKGGRRDLYLVAGEERFQVTASRWLATSIGESLLIEYAHRSRVVLMIDGEPERIPADPVAAVGGG